MSEFESMNYESMREQIVKNYKLNAQEVGKRIQLLRQGKIGSNKRISQEKFSEIIDISRVQLQKYESGKVLPKAKMIKKIASALNTSPEFIYGWTKNPNILSIEEKTRAIIKGKAISDAKRIGDIYREKDLIDLLKEKVCDEALSALLPSFEKFGYRLELFRAPSYLIIRDKFANKEGWIDLENKEGEIDLENNDMMVDYICKECIFYLIPIAKDRETYIFNYDQLKNIIVSFESYLQFIIDFNGNNAVDALLLDKQEKEEYKTNRNKFIIEHLKNNSKGKNKYEEE